MDILCVKLKIHSRPDFIFIPIRKGLDETLISLLCKQKYKKLP